VPSATVWTRQDCRKSFWTFRLFCGVRLTSKRRYRNTHSLISSSLRNAGPEAVRAGVFSFRVYVADSWRNFRQCANLPASNHLRHVCKRVYLRGDYTTGAGVTIVGIFLGISDRFLAGPPAAGFEDIGV
jgi:hypothetical protein